MNTLVIEHVLLNDLPLAWRNHLSLSPNTRVTVRIEEEGGEEREQKAATSLASNPLFGMWKGREEMEDVDAYTRLLRAARYSVDGSRNKG